MKRALIGLLIVAAVGAGVGAYYIKRGGPEIQIQRSPITRGDIVDTVGATGTLQAVTTVQVGSQVSGNISWLGADFNSIVHKGQVIAKLDPSLFEAQMEQSRANLSQAQANHTKAISDLERTKVALIDAQTKYARSKELSARNLLPQSDLDSAKIAVDTAQAQLGSQQATVKQTEAAVSQSQASVSQNQVNLDHTIITAPIDGIITQRSVDVGQTVAASMQAPTLFIIAADLTKLQVNASIDEADVGRIRPGQHVTFRVDAYAGETFEGTVSQIRLQPVVVQNVTTYGTVIDVPNAQMKLRPGMTANVKVEIAKRTDTMRVPNASLRFRPTPDMFAAFNQAVPAEAQPGGGRGRGGNRAGRGASAGQEPAISVGSGALQTSSSSATSPQATSPAGQPGQSSSPAPSTPGGSGQGGGGGRGFGGGGGGRGFDPARMMDRFKGMTPDEQKQFIARMKDRGQDTSAFEKEMSATAKASAKAQSPASALKPKYGTAGGGETIDALFAPLPTVESRGRAWQFVDKQFKPINLRLGITDGQNTEVMNASELPPNVEVVTGVTGVGATRNIGGPGGSGNPLIPGGNRGGPPGGGFGGPGRGR
ncbi:MAG TPA: efflux RND transporter periplasmic adaptor subunit [Vicinamibacterales bacterium]|nr:efflux RND transporter periplasmic adaptor subunit [Vicinamibacterales bacterium]